MKKRIYVFVCMFGCVFVLLCFWSVLACVFVCALVFVYYVVYCISVHICMCLSDELPLTV